MSDPEKSRRSFLQTAGLGIVSIPLSSCGILTKSDTPSTAPIVSQSGINSLLPPRLNKGNTIAIMAPAGAIFKVDYILSFKKILEELGFNVIEGKTLYAKYGYLAGEDEFRAQEFNSFFANPEVHGIIAMRGGWGCARMLDLIDYQTIAANPKVLMGFSDITSLLIAIYAKTGLVSFHGPMGYSSWNEYSMGYVKKILMEGRNDVVLQNPYTDNATNQQTINGGTAIGTLIGGNLTVIASIMGSSYLPNWDDKILFLEETQEEVYRIDRMITQLKLAGILDNIKGIVFGMCDECDPKKPEESLNLQEMLKGHFKSLRIPAFIGAAFGHVENNYTLPIGINAKLDADARTISLLDVSVR